MKGLLRPVCTMGDLPDTIGDLLDTMGDLPVTMFDLPVTMTPNYTEWTSRPWLVGFPDLLLKPSLKSACASWLTLERVVIFTCHKNMEFLKGTQGNNPKINRLFLHM